MTDFPDVGSAEFARKISEKFSKYKIIEDPEDLTNYCQNIGKSGLNSYQRVITEFVKGPYRGLLCNHGLGSGKTATAIEVSENLGRPVVVILPASLKDNFIGELLKFHGSKYGYAGDSYAKLTSEEKVKKNKDIMKRIGDKYKFVSYNAPNFVRQIEATTADTKGNPFDKRLIIIDEVHVFLQNIISGGSKQAIEVFRDLIMKAEDPKFVLLTGTPIVGDPFELAPLFNMLRGYLKDPRSGKVYTLMPTQREEFYKYFVDEDSGKIKNRDIFQDRINGLVSYYRGIRDPDHDVIPEKVGPVIVKCVMGVRQWSEYLRVRAYEWDFERKAKYKREVFIKAEYKKEKRESVGTYRIRSRQVCNIGYPEYIEKDVRTFEEGLKGIPRDEIFKKIDDYRSKLILKKLTLEDLRKNLGQYSMKMLKMMEAVRASPKGPIFVYSHFKTSGVRIFARVLEAHGFKRHDAPGKPNSDRFAIMDGDTDPMEKKKIHEVFNSPENKYGNLIKVLLGTAVVAAGFSFFNIRETYIMEPDWRASTLDQVIGRAIRMCGHKMLPKSERRVTVRVFLSEAPAKGRAALEIDEGQTTDQYLWSKIDRERQLNGSFLDAIHEAAFDCLLNQAHNGIPCRVCENDGPLYPFNIAEHIVLGSQCKRKIVREMRLEPVTVEGKKMMKDPETGRVYRFDEARNAYVLYK